MAGCLSAFWELLQRCCPRQVTLPPPTTVAPANVAADVAARGTCGYRLKLRRRLDTLGSLKLAAPGIASARNNVEQLQHAAT